jgi:hypothetical protein
MPITRIRGGVFAFAAILFLALLLPGFCECPTCVVIGSKAEPCKCTVLGVYLGRKALRFFTDRSDASRDVQGHGVGKRNCEKR